MTDTEKVSAAAARRLKRPLALTRIGMGSERLLRAFWPVLSIILLVLALLMLGIQDLVPVEAVWAAGAVSVLALAGGLIHGGRVMRWPNREEALERLDRTLPGRPIAALSDTQAVGAGDAQSEGLWAAHLQRMAKRIDAVEPVKPNLKLRDRDPYALRFAALIAFAMALIFGSVLRVSSVADMTPGAADGLASGPSWEGWVEPPAYTGAPSLYLGDLPEGEVAVIEGSRLTLRLYGEVGALSVTESVSGRTAPAEEGLTTYAFDLIQSGDLTLEGPGGRSWAFAVTPDAPPTVAFDGVMERAAAGDLEQRFRATDDYGVTSGVARIELALEDVDRRYGLSVDPDPREAIELDLPMPISGSRTEFSETLVENLSEHPWAGLPVRVTLSVEDAVGQTGDSAPSVVALPGRRFFDPLANAIIEQRRDLLWSKVNAPRVAQVLRAVSHRPDDLFRSQTAFLRLRVAIRRLESGYTYTDLSDDRQAEIAQVLWDLALEIEEGDLANALERLRRAQERLEEAIENGASQDEIAELMNELREAMQDYMRQLAEQQGQDGQQQQQAQGETQEITGQQLQDMLDRLQELMEQGRMAEAQELLDQLRQMMENMQVAQGQQGGSQSEGQQAMEGLAETLRQQQGLSDETFGDLQDQFNPGQPQGQQPGQQGQGQQPGQQGQGQQQGQQGQGQQPGQQPGQGNQPGQGQPGGQSGQGDPEGSLAERQQALREELERQRRNLPGAGTPEGDAAREALGRAGEAMEGAERDLAEQDFAGALDNQADAIEALREGMRELGEAMAQQQQGQGQQGDAVGQANPGGQRDPLGREAGQDGRVGTDEQLLQGEDVYRRAQSLLDEIRRRAGEQGRPDEELDYLRRLLDRF